MPKALGLVETKGLVAAIEAADAMVKAANVKFVGREITVPAMITVKVIGDTAAVKSAVDAGAAAAQRIGQLISTHIIPQPDSQLAVLLPEILDDKESGSKNVVVKKAEDNKEKVIQKSPPKTAKAPKPKPEKKEIIEVVVEQPEDTTVPETTNETLERLRKEALGTTVEKKTDKKETTKKEITGSIEDIDKLNVHELRHLARSISEFPIKGREISRANKGELLKYFGEIQK